jgi:dihydrolipoamide dehydrogenase
MSDNHFQAIVIGAGPGGYPCAVRLGQLGIKTLAVEKEYWGGVCLNVGCIPSKALITAGKQFEAVQSASIFGIKVEGNVSLDMGELQAWKGTVVDKLTKGVRGLLKGNKVTMAFGTAHVTGANEVTVTDADGNKTVYTADNIVVATGSSPIQIPGFAFADPPILDSTKALDLPVVPKHLMVIGGGYIGLEMGMMFNKLGAKVTVIEMQNQVLPGFDPDVVKLLKRKLKRSGVAVHTESRALGWEATDDGVALNIETPKGPLTLDGDYILVTVGRRPNSKGLGLEELGIEFDGPFVKVDKQLRTSVSSIFAIGDVAGQPMLAHKATHEGEVVAEVIAGHKVQYDARTVPAVVFTDPEVATAGMDEAQARARGEIKIGKMPFAAIGRSQTTTKTDGFVKMIIDAKTHRVLGVTIIGEHASDLISEAALAIEMDAEALDIGLTIHPHPTLGESMMEAAKAALGEAVHIINR